MTRLTEQQPFPPVALPLAGGGVLKLPDDLIGMSASVLVSRGPWCPVCPPPPASFSPARARRSCAAAQGLNCHANPRPPPSNRSGATTCRNQDCAPAPGPKAPSMFTVSSTRPCHCRHSANAARNCRRSKATRPTCTGARNAVKLRWRQRTSYDCMAANSAKPWRSPPPAAHCVCPLPASCAIFPTSKGAC